MVYQARSVSFASVGGFTAGSIPFAGSNGSLKEQNSALFFDEANGRLGVGTASPQQRIHTIGVVRADTGFSVVSGGITGAWSVDASGAYFEAQGANSLRIVTNGTTRLTFDSTGLATAQDGLAFVLGTVTGTKFGTATSQKLGFFNKTPVVQRGAIAAYTNTGVYATDAANIKTAVDAIRQALIDLGLTA